MKKIVVGFHGFCMDGIGSLVAVIHKFGKDNVIPVPLHHSKKAESFQRLTDVIENNSHSVSSVAILDFSFDFDTMSELADQCEDLQLGLLVIDHHEGVFNELKMLMNYSDEQGTDIVIDASKSGALLTWDYYFPSKPVPAIFNYIDDADRWQWKLPNSRSINAVLVFLTGKTDYDKLHELMSLSQNEIQQFAGSDYAYIEEYMNKTTDLYTVGVKTQQLNIGNETIDIILKPCDLAFSSVVGEAYYNIRTDVHAVVMYSGVGQNVELSVRSNKQFYPNYARRIAQHFGGNGHPEAAGCRIPRKQFVELFLR